MYWRGMTKGTIAAANVSTPILVHMSQPSEASSGLSVYVADGHISR